ncbi:PAAR domain-containing protein [Pseudomonas syringae USA007]|uniref:PAAR domain-containing protein n=1 Tax=Pseudomonas syringae USA007 TaxID=1357288 RepID=A0AAU8MBL1_PSESX|nr:PAAR domain-containing protein [Pseudomonas syringae]
MLPLIVIGDMTSHGGVVVSGAATMLIDGKGCARIGDMVTCPRCKGVFPIAEGDPSLIEDGKAIAYHGCRTTCGAMLYSSQVSTMTYPSSGAASGVQGGLNDRFGSVSPGLVAGYEDEPLDSSAKVFRGRFQVLDAATGKPIAGQPVRVRSSEGQYLTGSTDDEGFTQWVERDTDEALAFYLIDEPGQS